MILEGGKPVSHCRMAGISRLGKQAEIGQLQCFGQGGPLLLAGLCISLAVIGMEHNQCNQKDVNRGNKGKYEGFAHQIVTIEEVIPWISVKPA
jgi:hypothetical protein